MPAVLLVIRSLLRRRIAATVALVVLIGIAGGAVLTAAAGARRTATAFPRLLDHVDTSDVTIFSSGAIQAEDLRHLDSVQGAADAIGFGIAAEGPDGLPDLDSGPGSSASTNGGPYFETDRPFVLAGRLPDPDRADEVAVNEVGAELFDVAAGDRKRFYLFAFDDLETLPDIPEGQEPTPEDLAALRSVMTPLDLRIVGVGRSPSEIVANENQLGPLMLFTPAFYRAHEDAEGYRLSYVDLVDPVRDESRFRAALAREYPDEPVQVQTRDALTATARRAIGPYGEALTLFAIVGGLTSLLVVGQALARQVAADASDDAVLGSLGMSRAHVAAAAAGRSVLSAWVGTAVAVGVAVIASPLFPLGPARRAEPDPGIRLELTVLGGFALLMVVLLTGRVAIASWRQARLLLPPGAGAIDARRHWVSPVEGLGLPAPATAGIRMAFRPNERNAASARSSTLVGLVVALSTVLAALTFGASLDHLVSTPASYGWSWDALLDTYENGVSPELVRSIRRDEDIAEFTLGARSSLTLGGFTMAGFGFETGRGNLLPTVTSGRFPDRPDEIALGAAALRRLHRSVGDTVTATDAEGQPTELRIVGETPLPSLNLDDVYGLADGASMTLDGIAQVATVANPSFMLVNFAPDAGPNPIAQGNRRYGGFGTFLDVQRPGDIASYAGVRRTPLILAALLAILGLGVLIHGLLTVVRGERRAVAVLKTLGLTRRQIRAVVRWHVNSLMVVAILVAVPLGVAAGRSAWAVLPDRLGLPADPVLPVGAVVALLVGALVVANLVAIVPAAMAARTRPARLLRAE